MRRTYWWGKTTRGLTEKGVSVSQQSLCKTTSLLSWLSQLALNQRVFTRILLKVKLASRVTVIYPSDAGTTPLCGKFILFQVCTDIVQTIVFLILLKSSILLFIPHIHRPCYNTHNHDVCSTLPRNLEEKGYVLTTSSLLLSAHGNINTTGQAAPDLVLV